MDYNQYSNLYNQALNGFMNSGNYMLSYGNNQASDPGQRFLNDPAQQLALQQSMNAVGNNYAARGLGQSGALGIGLQNALFQNYDQWNQQQQGLLQNYQGQLSQLAGQGQAVNGSNLAGSNAQTLAQMINSGQLSTGQALAMLYQNTGQNISGLLANQGVFNANAILNTGAAQSNNLFRTSELGAELNANNAASYAGTQNSLFGAQGAMNTANAFNSGGNSGNPFSGSNAYGSYF